MLETRTKNPKKYKKDPKVALYNIVFSQPKGVWIKPEAIAEQLRQQGFEISINDIYFQCCCWTEDGFHKISRIANCFILED